MLYLITDNILFSSKIMANLKANAVEAASFSTDAALLAALPEGTPVCVVANLNARTYDAIALVQRLKADGHTVVAFCGHADTYLREVGLESGADKVIANSAITMNAAGALKAAGVLE